MPCIRSRTQLPVDGSVTVVYSQLARPGRGSIDGPVDWNGWWGYLLQTSSGIICQALTTTHAQQEKESINFAKYEYLGNNSPVSPLSLAAYWGCTRRLSTEQDSLFFFFREKVGKKKVERVRQKNSQSQSVTALGLPPLLSTGKIAQNS